MKNIQVYNNVFNLFCDHLPEATKNLDEDAVMQLEHTNDYESIVYYVINYSDVYIVDSISGDVLTIYDLLEFFDDMLSSID